MSTQIDESLVVAAHCVHRRIWETHWQKGHTVLRSDQVVGFIRDVRTNAGCDEQQLPTGLRELLAQARLDRIQSIALDKLLAALKAIEASAA